MTKTAQNRDSEPFHDVYTYLCPAREPLFELRGRAVINLLALGDERLDIGKAVLHRSGGYRRVVEEHIVDRVFKPQVCEILGKAHLRDVFKIL